MESSAMQSTPSSIPPSPSNPLPPALSEEQFSALLDDVNVRKDIRRTLKGWQLIYVSNYLTLTPADFHDELDTLLDDRTIRLLSIIGFRGSAKSSKGSLALPIYLALEYPEDFPFIIIVAETRDQVVENIANVRHELEENEMILLDYGDMSKGVSKQKEWTKTSILLKNGVKILGLSRGQRIRGRRHREDRPSIVIVDDPEEAEKVEKKAYRDKTERWLRGEVIPAIEESKARLIVLGNILHTDAIMQRLKNDPIFVHRDYALFKTGDSESWENCTWKGKYPTQAAIEQKKKEVRYTSWMREYRLKVVPPDGQEVKEEWIQYYDEIPKRYMRTDPRGQIAVDINPISRTGVGVDLAISKQQTADFTAMVSGVVAEKVVEEGENARLNGDPKIYVLPNPVNDRMSFLETIQRMKGQNQAIEALYSSPVFYIEDVGYQRVAIEEAQRQGIVAEPRKVGTDKRSRLRAAATFIQNGMVLFPRKGAEDLIAQLTGFGIEDHDDLADAFVHLVLGIRSGGTDKPQVIVLG